MIIYTLNWLSSNFFAMLRLVSVSARMAEAKNRTKFWE